MTDLAGLAPPPATDGRARIEALRARSPGAARLAALVSTAVRVEPDLLRRARLLVPDLDVAAETDLWASDLFASVSQNGFAFEAPVAAALREDLAGLADEALRWSALDAVDRAHRERDPFTRLEERIHRLDVEGGTGATAAQEELVLAAVGELRRMADDPARAEERRGVARWLLGAYSRLPARLQAGDAGVAAGIAGGLHLDGRTVEPGGGAEGQAEAWLPWLLREAGSTGEVTVGVRLGQRRLEVNAEGPGAGLVRLPATDPLVVDVEPHGVETLEPLRLRFRPGAPVVVPVTSDSVSLVSLSGERFTVRSAGAPPSAGGYDFSTTRAALRPCLARDGLVDRVVEEALRSRRNPARGRPSRGGGPALRHWVILDGPEGTGKSVVLNAALDRLAGQEGVVVASHFYGVREGWDEPAAVAASVSAQLRAAAPSATWRPMSGAAPESVVRITAIDVADATTRAVVVVVDGLPGTGDDLRQFLSEASPLPSSVPDGVHILATTRDGSAVSDWLDPRSSHLVLRTDSEEELVEVCREMVGEASTRLALAFGPRRAAAPAQVHGASRLADLAIEPSIGDRLIQLAGLNPGRLAAIIDHLLSLPVGTAAIEAIPPPLTVREEEVWQAVESTFLDLRGDGIGETAAEADPLLEWLPAAMVAGDGFTVDELARVLTQQRHPSPRRMAKAMAGRGRALGLLDPAGAGPSHPSVLASFVRRFGPEAQREGHLLHAGGWPKNPQDASPYEVAMGIRHLMAAGDHLGAVSLAGDVRFLERRFRETGLAALQDDLALVTQAESATSSRGVDVASLQRALSSVATTLLAEPDRFVDLLCNELARTGLEPLGMLAPRWPLALTLRRVIDTEGWSPIAHLAARGASASLVGGDLEIVTPERGWPEAPVAWSSTADGLVVAAGQSLFVGPGEGPPERLQVGSADVTAVTLTWPWICAGDASGLVTALRRRDDGEVDDVGQHYLDSSWERRLLPGHTGAVTDLHAERGGVLLSASTDGTVRVWDVAAGRCLLVYRGHHAPVRALARDDQGLMVSGDDRGGLRRWDHRTGADQAPIVGHRAAVTAIVTLPGSRLLTTGLDGGVIRWDLRSAPSVGRDVLREAGPPITHAASGSRPVLPVTWETGGVLRWWDESGAELAALRPREVVEPVRQLLAASTADTTMLVVHAEGATSYGLTTWSPDGGRAWQGALDMSPNGVQAAIGSRRGIAIWDLDRGTEVDRRGATLPAISVAAGGRGFSWMDEGSLVHDLRDSPGLGSQLAPPARLASGTTFEGLATVDGHGSAVTYMADLGSEQIVRLEGAPVPASALAAGHGGRWIAVGGRDGTLVVGTPDGVDRTTLSSPATSLAFVGSALLLGCEDGSVGLWVPFRPNEPVRRFGRHGATVTGLAVSGDLAATASGDGTIRVWDVVNARLCGLVRGPAGFTAIASRAARAVARTEDGELWVFDIAASARTQDPTVLIETAEFIDVGRSADGEEV